MFSRARDTSKIALVYLIARLKYGGFRLLDTQFITEHLAQFGALEISRQAFQRLLEDALDITQPSRRPGDRLGLDTAGRSGASFTALPADASPTEVLRLANSTSDAGKQAT